MAIRPNTGSAARRAALAPARPATGDTGAVGRFVTDSAGFVTETNAAMADMLGYRPEQMIGRPTTDFVPTAGYAAVRAAAHELRDAADRPMVLARRTLRHRDGRNLPFVVTSSVLRDLDGAPTGWLSLVVDVARESELPHGSGVPGGVDVAAGHVTLLRAAAATAATARALDEFAAALVGLVCTQFGWVGGGLLRGDALVPGTTWGHFDGLLAAAVAVPGGRERVHTHPAVPDATLTVVEIASAPARSAFVFTGRGGPDADGAEVLGLVAGQADVVAERESAAQRAREDEARFRSVFDSSPLPMALSIGDSGLFAEVNQALCELLGRRPEELIGSSASAFLHPDDVALADPAGAAAAAAPDGRHRAEARFVHSSGRVVATLVTLAWIGDAEPRQLLAQFEDITARRQAEHDLRWQAEHDALTGLSNRTHLTRTLARYGRDRDRCALLFVDVDGFKTINDVRGHDIGDEVLVAVGHRLRLAVRPGDFVARFGGDEFVVVVPETSRDAHRTLDRIADRVGAAMQVPVPTSAGELPVTVSMGMAVGRIDPRSPHQLLRRADTAMFRAKSAGRGRKCWYDAPLHRATLSRERVENRLRSALDENRIEVHYQPVVRLGCGEVRGYEALVRLRDERGRLHQPGEFIEVAEQSGLVVPLGTLVLREACRILARLRCEGGSSLVMSVNVAAQQAARDDLVDVVGAALDDSGLPPDALVLELTESSLLDATDSTLAQLVALRRRGIGIALDDFGTGYSSLTHLRRFPVSCLKIDRTFVSDMIASSAGRAIVRSVVALATDLELSWVAEGIETEEQAAVVRALGRGFGQGYLFGRPVPADELFPVRPGRPVRHSA